MVSEGPYHVRTVPFLWFMPRLKHALNATNACDWSRRHFVAWRSVVPAPFVEEQATGHLSTASAKHRAVLPSLQRHGSMPILQRPNTGAHERPVTLMEKTGYKTMTLYAVLCSKTDYGVNDSCRQI